MDISPSLLRPAAMTALLVVALAGCASADEDGTEEPGAATPTTADEAAGELAQEVLSVTFDGTSCSYDGPNEVRAGVVAIEAVNDSAVYTEVGIALVDESSTFEDVVAFYQPEPEVVDSPDFATPIGAVPAEPGQTGSDSFSLGIGQYALVCLILVADEPPPGVFVAQPGGVTVTD